MYPQTTSSYHYQPPYSWRRWVGSQELVQRMVAEERWMGSYESLKRQYHRFSRDVDGDPLMTQHDFEAFLLEVNSRWASHVCEQLYPLIDRDADGYVDFPDFAMTVMCTFLEGRPYTSSPSAYFKARRQLLFTYYDTEGKGFLTTDDWHRLTEDTMEYWSRHENANPKRVVQDNCTADMVLCMEAITQSPRESWNTSSSRKLDSLNAFWQEQKGLINFDTFSELCDRHLLSDRGIRLRFSKVPRKESSGTVHRRLATGAALTQAILKKAVDALPSFTSQLMSFAADLRNSAPTSQLPNISSEAEGPLPDTVPHEALFPPPPSTQMSSPIVVNPEVCPAKLQLSPDPSPRVATFGSAASSDVAEEFFTKRAEAPLLVPTTTASEAEDAIEDDSCDFFHLGESSFEKEQELFRGPTIQHRIVDCYIRRCIDLVNGNSTVRDPAGLEGKQLVDDLNLLAQIVQQHCVNEPLVAEFCPADGLKDTIWAVGALHGDLADTIKAVRIILGAKDADQQLPRQQVLAAHTSVIFTGNVMTPGGLQCTTISSLQALACVWVLKAMFPEHVTLLRGSNEAEMAITASKSIMDALGVEEINRLYNRICDAWEATSIALLAGNKFCVFGGALTLEVLHHMVEIRKLTKPFHLTQRELGPLADVIRASWVATDIDELRQRRLKELGKENLPDVIIEQQHRTCLLNTGPIKSCLNILLMLDRLSQCDPLVSKVVSSIS